MCLCRTATIYPCPTTCRSRGLPHLTADLERFEESLANLAGKKITEDDFWKRIDIMNRNRQAMKKVYETRKVSNPQIAGLESMYMVVLSQMVEKSERTRIVEEALAELRQAVQVKDRVARQIAVVPNELCRVMSDTRPPWAFLKIFRYMEKFGCVSVGSRYTWGLDGMWVYDDKSPDFKSNLMIAIARLAKLNGVMLYYNRGCEGMSLRVAENHLALQKTGFPVMTFEGNRGTSRT